MFKRKISAGTADEKSYKCTSVFGRPAMAAMLLLCAVFSHAQRKKDTIRVLILYSDTSFKGISIPTKSTFVLSVRELHNNTEGLIDPYINYGFKYEEYYKHIYFITEDKKKLPKNWVVWQSVSAK